MLPALGFQFIQKTASSKEVIDLFSHRKCTIEENTEKVEEPLKQGIASFEVKLISAARIPAQHEKMVKAKVCNGNFAATEAGIFEMSVDFARDSGVTIEDAIVKPRDDNHITLIVRNSGFSPVCLQEGRIIGSLEETTLLCEKEMPWVEKKNPAVVRALKTSDDTSLSTAEKDWCDVYTDHEVLKSLLNTPQPSGRLARWGMALQELDLHTVYTTGLIKQILMQMHYLVFPS